MWTRDQAQDLAPPPRIITEEDKRRNRLQQRCLLVAKADERAMAEWRARYLQDVVDEQAFWTQRRAERVARREDKRQRKRAAEADMDNIDTDSDRWGDLCTSSDYTTEEEE